MSRANWNEPLDVVETNEVFYDGERLVTRVDWHVVPEDIEMIREGRKCLNCMEVFKTGDGMSLAWPTWCPVCQYPVAERQAKDFGKEYLGEVRVGPRTSDTEEIDRMEYERQSRIWTPGSSSSIPRDLRGT